MASHDPIEPNVVFIMTDDQGPWALGCAGNREIRTPNLDRIAATGMRFDSFFCTSPVCSPARASLLTGRIPSQHGVHDWIREGNAGDRPVEYLKGQTGYTEILAAQGYRCAMSGKWHMGDSYRLQKGFTHWYVHERGGGPYYNAPMIRNGKLEHDPGYVSDLITDDALDYLAGSARQEGPFYLSVHYTAPHSPWIDNHPRDIVESYADCAFESCPQEPRHSWIGPRTGPQEQYKDLRECLKGYFAAVTAMDLNVGRLLDRLQSLDLTESTVVFFTSDNGYNCGHHGIWGKGNGTFPLNMYDSSVKVPTLISQPGRISQGVVCDELLSGYDFMPTLLDYLGFDNPEAGNLPGKSFAHLLAPEAAGGAAGTSTGRDEPIVVYDEYGPVRMIRSREWKYVHRFPYGPHELYNLAQDPGERRNMIDDADCRDTVLALKGGLDEWFARYVDPLLDGTHESVTGKGQLNLAGPAGRGTQAFARLE